MRARVRMTVGRSRVQAELVRRGVVRWSAEATHQGPGDLAHVIAQLGAERELRGARRLEVRLEAPAVQLRTLSDLPPVRRSLLAALIANQAPRYFRKNGAPLVTAAAWLPRAKGAAPQAQAAAVELSWLEAISSGASAAGLTVISVVPATGSPRLRLPVPGQQRPAHRLDRLSAAWLAIFAVVLWGGTLGLYVARLHQERVAADEALRGLSAPLAAMRDVRRELDAVQAMADAVDRDATGRGRMVVYMGRIAATLPDSSYLTSLTIDRDGNGLMTGYARRAAQVVAALEREHAVTAPRLEGPALKEAVAGREWERFTIAFGRERS